MEMLELDSSTTVVGARRLLEFGTSTEPPSNHLEVPSRIELEAERLREWQNPAEDRLAEIPNLGPQV